MAEWHRIFYKKPFFSRVQKSCFDSFFSCVWKFPIDSGLAGRCLIQFYIKINAWLCVCLNEIKLSLPLLTFSLCKTIERRTCCHDIFSPTQHCLSFWHFNMFLVPFFVSKKKEFLLSQFLYLMLLHFVIKWLESLKLKKIASWKAFFL